MTSLNYPELGLAFYTTSGNADIRVSLLISTIPSQLGTIVRAPGGTPVIQECVTYGIPPCIAPTATPIPTFTPTPTPTPAPTQTGGGGQIAYDGGCMRPDGMYALGAFCGLNVSGGDTFYLTTGDDPALASGNRVAVVVNSGGGQFASGECTQSHIPPEG